MDKRPLLPPQPRTFSTAPDPNDSGLSIPSFSSAPDLSDIINDRGSDGGGRKSKKHKRERKRSSSPPSHRRSPSPSSRRRRSRSPSYHRSSSRRHRSRESERRRRRHRRSPSPPHYSGQLDTGLTFVIDKRGDPDNLTFGENHSYKAPSFQRSGGGQIIGLPSNLRIDLSRAKSSNVLSIIPVGSKKKRIRYTDPEYSWKESDKAMKRIRIKPKLDHTSDSFSDGAGFITLQQEREHRKKRKDLADEAISSGVDYRSIEGPKARDEEEAESDEDDDSEGESFDEYVRRRTIESNRHLDTHPHDVDAWLAFIEFQDEAAKGLNTGSDSKIGRSKANKASLNEVKMSIFEKALEHNPNDEKLLLAYLESGEQTWDTLTLLREWDKALKKNPESIRLWADYINLRQTNFASFSFTQCIKVFEDCILTLNRMARRLQRSRKEEDNLEARESIESIMVYIFLRACLFMKQSGYQERAFGSLQALVEFTLFQPPEFRTSEDVSFGDMIEAFCEFWDTEVPRFGEQNAKGWREYYKTKKAETTEDSRTNVPGVDDQPDLFSLQDWVRWEQSRESKNRMPSRMSIIDPNIIDQDPYVVTLADDIRDLMFDVTTHEARQALIYSIFVFLGLPFTPPGVGTNTHFCIDTFTHNEMKLPRFWPPLPVSEKSLHITYVDGIAMEPEHVVEDKNIFDYPSSYPVGDSELFARHGVWFACLESCHLDYEADAVFARNALDQLNKLRWDNHLAICHLALESSYSYKRGKKLAKEMLKEHRNNLILWNVYAQMEKSHGRVNEARRVYQTALAGYKDFPKPDQEASPLLYSAFAQLELDENRPDEALSILVAMGTEQAYVEEGPSPTSAQILKAQNFYTQKTAQTSLLIGSAEEVAVAHHYVVCYALFQYLTRGIDAASAVYESSLDYIQERQAERGFESEILWVSYVRTLYRHATTGGVGYRPAQLRIVLERALKLFPNNTVFIALFVWNETRTKIYNRVRNVFTSSLKSGANIILWLSAIRTELHRCYPYDANLVRSLFESAIESVSTRASVLIWRLYIDHEVRTKNLERAKALYYRAVRACPWSKELYLLGIQALSRSLTEKELHEIVSLMMEKEIRLRCPIDDALLMDEGHEELIKDDETTYRYAFHLIGGCSYPECV
ncbi:NRDE-2, necessary for RNA interference-domain-containing protein [Dichotomocladium elegans]|nr:NRDE-2, necessary for RNA interference-domain-containing protein [Dichotomocladium elegans]